MKKIIFVICVVLSVTMILPIFIVYAEKNMKTTDDLNDDLVQYSALKVDDSIKASIGAKDDQTVIRIHNMPIIYAFGNCDSIEEILKSEYINATCYMVMDGMELVSVYKDFNGKLYLMDMANSRIPYDHETRTILINESILEKLPQNAHMLDVYYLWGQTSYQGSALYYKTDLGDFVYYKYYSVGGKQYLFPASVFFSFMKAYYATLDSDTAPSGEDMETVYDLSKYDIDSNEFDLNLPTENKSALMRALPWLSAVVLISGGGAVLFWIKKRKKLSKKSL